MFPNEKIFVFYHVIYACFAELDISQEFTTKINVDNNGYYATCILHNKHIEKLLKRPLSLFVRNKNTFRN